MRKLILQIQTSADGFIESVAGDSWTVWNWIGEPTWDAQLISDFNSTFVNADTVLLSRPLVDEGYIDHWTAAGEAHPGDARFDFARRIAAAEKLVVTARTYDASRYPHTRVITGDFAASVDRTKRGDGGDILAFGGTSFASALVAHGFVDELRLYVNPTAVGQGRGLFERATPLELIGTSAYECGIVVTRYRPLT